MTVCVKTLLVFEVWPVFLFLDVISALEETLYSGSAHPRRMNIIKPIATEKNVRNFDIKMAFDEPLCSFTLPNE